MAADEECIAISNADSSKQSKEKYFGTAFRGKTGDSRNKVMSLLWAKEGDYWKIIAIRIEDSNDAGVVPANAAAQTEPSVEEPQSIAGDPAAVKDITEFYQTWIVKRNVTQASSFASQRSYECLPAPSEEQKKLTPIARIQSGLEQPLTRISIRHESLGDDVECSAGERFAAPSSAGKLQCFRDDGSARPEGQ